MNEWQSTKKSWPAEGVAVLVTDGVNVLIGGIGQHYSITKKKVVIDWYGDNLGYYGGNDSFPATHWMPLPNPPVGGGN